MLGASLGKTRSLLTKPNTPELRKSFPTDRVRGKRKKTLVCFVLVLLAVAVGSTFLKPKPRYFSRQLSDSVAFTSDYTFGQYKVPSHGKSSSGRV